MKNVFFPLMLLFFMVSCIPTKDLTYLQGQPRELKDIQRIIDKPYRLQVDDVLSIQVKTVNERIASMFEDLTNSSGVGNFQNGGNNNQQGNFQGNLVNGYAVDKHGNIRLPYLGEFNVLGYTTVEVRQKLETEISKLFKNKEDLFVTVRLAGIKYTIIGEIASPGTRVIRQNTVNIIEAISNSGDIKQFGNRKKVELIRFNGDERKKYYVDLTQIDALDSDIFYIQPNDIINVLPLKQKSWGTDTTGLGVLTTVVSVLSLIASSVVLARSL